MEKYRNTGAFGAWSDAPYSHNRHMITYTGYKQYPEPAESHPLLPNPAAGLPIETIMSLSEQARFLYDNIFNYCTYHPDPQYQKLHTYRKRIASLDSPRDRDILIGYFNSDPAIRWNGIPEEPYEYYKKDYYNS